MKKQNIVTKIHEDHKKLKVEYSDIESMANYSIPAKKIRESSMSDISITAIDSTSLLDFAKKIKKEYPELFPVNPKLTAETLKWLKIIYMQTKENK